jgi:cephalosporin hydroxylase
MRAFKTAFSQELLRAIQAGTLAYTYKGVRCLKDPFELAIYSKLIWDLRPASLIEIGTNQGGSALWFADGLSCAGLSSPVVSIDLAPPAGTRDPRVEFLRGDAARLGETLTPARLDRLPHPWLVVEDSSHHYDVTLAAIRFFDATMKPGDVLVVEDGVLDELGLTDQYEGGPNRAVAEFLTESPGRFRIMTEYCDMFGVNATYNPNAYLLRL